MVIENPRLKMHYCNRKYLMKNIILKLVQFIGFKIYYFANKIGIFKIGLFEDLFIEFYFLYKSKIESTGIDFLKKYMVKNITIIDVGANIGFFTIQISKFLDKSANIIAIEPSSENVLRMQKVIKRKSPEPDISIIFGALSDKKGWGHLKMDASNPANHKILEVEDFENSVELQTLDSITENIFNVKLIKIDVQGYELSVLRGGERLLNDQSPVLLIEIDNRIDSKLSLKIWDFLIERGYLIFVPTNLTQSITRSDLEDLDGYFDVFCIKQGNS